MALRRQFLIRSTPLISQNRNYVVWPSNMKSMLDETYNASGQKLNEIKDNTLDASIDEASKTVNKINDKIKSTNLDIDSYTITLNAGIVQISFNKSFKSN